ncbi:MAG TPA: hypothetical protein DCQ64_19560, partial [Candidatus Rokubacteria bacterium]|nr:hypothetical protein [Candidatus Rokubacteria bacterium]
DYNSRRIAIMQQNADTGTYNATRPQTTSRKDAVGLALKAANAIKPKPDQYGDYPPGTVLPGWGDAFTAAKNAARALMPGATEAVLNEIARSAAQAAGFRPGQTRRQASAPKPVVVDPTTGKPIERPK